MVNYLLELPFGKGKRFLNRGGLVDKLVAGWQFSGINRYQSGTPLSFFTSDPVNTDFLQLTGYLGNLRLNPTGQPITTSGAFINNRFGRQVINPAAFVAPPQFGSGFNNNPSGATVASAAYASYYANPLRFFGSAAPALSNVHGPRFYSEDVSLLKKTHILETVTLELGAEAFNLFQPIILFLPDHRSPRRRELGFQRHWGEQSAKSTNPRACSSRLGVD